MLLGNNGGIGRIHLGTYDSFYTTMVSEAVPALQGAMGKVVYTPLNQDNDLKQNEFVDGKLYVNDAVLLDIVDGVHAPSINIRLREEVTQTYIREVRHDNLLIGTFTIVRGSVPFDAGAFSVYHGDYATQSLPVGGSSNNPMGQAVVLMNHA